MGRANKQKARDKNKASLPQTPKNQLADGVDEEFSMEFADQADKDAKAREKAANERVKRRK